MEKISIPLEFEYEYIHYKGWATPSDKRHPDGKPASYHVVLNGVFFGNLSLNEGKWNIDEQRPDDLFLNTAECLAKAVGKFNPPE